ncbi:MAG: hypothetical protein SOY67_06190 [Collinsella sp.]|nr:hypothetical protein [Collinsella sp.]
MIALFGDVLLTLACGVVSVGMVFGSAVLSMRTRGRVLLLASGLVVGLLTYLTQIAHTLDDVSTGDLTCIMDTQEALLGVSALHFILMAAGTTLAVRRIVREL